MSQSRDDNSLEIVPRSVWCCGDGYEELSSHSTLMELEVLPQNVCVNESVRIKIDRPGTCHALVLWIDVYLDDKKNYVVGTGC